MTDPHWLTVARRKLSVGTEWKWCRIEAVDKSCRPNARRDMIIEGAIPTVLFERGPRKGQPNWKKATGRLTTVVTQEEEEAESTAYEATTGLCGRCFGKGQVVAGMGVGGTTYRECNRCKGSGNKPLPTPDGQKT